MGVLSALGKGGVSSIARAIDGGSILSRVRVLSGSDQAFPPVKPKNRNGKGGTISKYKQSRKNGVVFPARALGAIRMRAQATCIAYAGKLGRTRRPVVMVVLSPCW